MCVCVYDLVCVCEYLCMYFCIELNNNLCLKFKSDELLKLDHTAKVLMFNFIPTIAGHKSHDYIL